MKKLNKKKNVFYWLLVSIVLIFEETFFTTICSSFNKKKSTIDFSYTIERKRTFKQGKKKHINSTLIFANIILIQIISIKKKVFTMNQINNTLSEMSLNNEYVYVESM